MSGLVLVPEPAIALSAPAEDTAMAVIASVLQAATDAECTVRDVMKTLLPALSQALGVDGVRLILADGDDLWIRRPYRAWGVDQRSRVGLPIPDEVLDPSLAELGSVVAMPLLAVGRSWGMLELHWATARVWTEREQAAAQALAVIAAHSIAVSAHHSRVLTTESDPHYGSRDALTGLPNHRLLADRLAHAVLQTARRRAAVGILLLNIDGLKDINDTMGRPFGDLVLMEVARKLRLALRTEDTVARLSGNEFVIVCEDLIGSPSEIEQGLQALGRRIRRELRRPPHPGEPEVVVSVNIGIAVTTRRRAVEDLIAEARHVVWRVRQRRQLFAAPFMAPRRRS